MESNKMEKPIIKIHNAATGEIEDREMTDAEFTQYKAEQEIVANQRAEEKAKEIAKTELLKRLGITADEAALLLS
jgi:hypothetical protein